MFELTATAGKELDAFFEGKEKSPIRIYLAPGGCSGPRLALALDAPNDGDKVLEDKGYSFCINTELLEHAKNIKIDFSNIGFSIQSDLPMGGGGCGGCSGCSTDDAHAS